MLSDLINKLGKKVLISSCLIGALGAAEPVVAEVSDEKVVMIVNDGKENRENKSIKIERNNEDKKKSVSPVRVLELPVYPGSLADSSGFLALENFCYSSINASGFVNDTLGVDLGWDDNWGRIGTTALAVYTIYAAGYYCHEIAHDLSDLKYSPKYGFELDWSDWRRGFPGKKYKYSAPYGSIDDVVKNLMAPQMQEELNSAKGYERALLQQEVPFDMALYLFVSKTSDLFYRLGFDLVYGFEEHLPNEINQDSTDLAWELYEDLETASDSDEYVIQLYNSGKTRMSKSRFRMELLAADLLSGSTYDNASAVINYVVDGKRVHKPFMFSFGEYKVSPPHIIHLATSEGSHYDLNTWILHNEGIINFSLGTYTGILFDDSPKNLRLGVGLNVPYIFSIPIDVGKRKKLPLEGRVGMYSASTFGEKEGVLVGFEGEFKFLTPYFFPETRLKADVYCSINDPTMGALGQEKGCNSLLSVKINN